MIPLETVRTSSTVAELDLVAFDSTKYTNYMVSGFLAPSTDGAAGALRLSTDGGDTFVSGASAYEWGAWFARPGTNLTGPGLTSASEVRFAGSVGNGANEIMTFHIEIFDPHDTAFTFIIAKTYMTRTDSTGQIQFQYARTTSEAAHDAIRFFFETGNITSGELTLYALHDF